MTFLNGSTGPAQEDLPHPFALEVLEALWMTTNEPSTGTVNGLPKSMMGPDAALIQTHLAALAPQSQSSSRIRFTSTVFLGARVAG